MKEATIFYKHFCLAIVTCLFFITSEASHLVGSYMWYTHISGNDYILHLRIFRDCSGISASDSAKICYGSLSSGIQVEVYLPKTNSFLAPLNSCASIGTTTCNGGTDYGIKQIEYEKAVTLTNPANDWLFKYTECCRNAALTTIVPSSLYTYCTLDNLTLGINNSPLFPAPFIGLYCAGQLTNINYSATDPDGDSLAYSLVTAQEYHGIDACPYDPPTTCIYQINYSFLQPLSSFTPVTLNSSTGLFSFTPTKVEIGEVCILVEEFRNGIKVGSIKRDDQIVIVTEISNPSKIRGKVFADYNGNGIQDAGDNDWTGIVIDASPANLLSASDVNGNYFINVIPGTYSCSPGNLPQYYSSSPITHNINVLSLGQSFYNKDFAVYPTQVITDLSVSVSSMGWVTPNSINVFYIHVKNQGTVPASGVLSFMHDLKYNYQSSNPAYNTYNTNFMTWNLPVINPSQVVTYQVNLQVPTTAVAGDSLYFDSWVITSTPDNNVSNNKMEGYDYVRASHDPNTIHVNPPGAIPTSFISNGDWLYYTINFQNTGTAAASNVTVYNGLDFNLNASSVEFIGSSHSCLFKISGIGLLKFVFSNIQLAAAVIDEPNSHGYLVYRIKPKATLIPSNFILNNASIVFDFNSSLNTNTVQTDVVNSNATGIQNLCIDNMEIKIFPNPFHDVVSISMDDIKLLKIEFYDLKGSLVQSTKINQTSLVNTAFKNGLYLYKITDLSGNFVFGKLLKE